MSTRLQALFIDDNLRNVKAAEALGITSIHFQSPAQAIDRPQTMDLL